MKYIVTAMICTMIGVGVMHLNADAPEGIYGQAFRSDTSDIDSVMFGLTSGEDDYQGNTQDHLSNPQTAKYSMYLANKNGTPNNPNTWHIYIPQGYSYTVQGTKYEDSQLWQSPVYGPFDYTTENPTTHQNLYLSLQGD